MCLAGSTYEIEVNDDKEVWMVYQWLASIVVRNRLY